MRNASLRFFVASAALLPTALSLAPATARACSAPNCREPAGFPATATLPANAAGVFLDPGSVGFTPYVEFSAPGLRLEVPGAAPLELTVDVVDASISAFGRLAVHTATSLPVGSTLVLHATSACAALGADGGAVTPVDVGSWTITDAVPLPTTLGTLTVDVVPQGTVPMPVYTGECDQPATTSYAAVTLVPSTDASPWSDLFVYETVVDGTVFLPSVTASPFNGYSSQSQSFGGSWLGRGVDHVYARCGTLASGVSEGTHSIAMRARLPDGTVVTTPAVEVTLACPPSVVDAGVDSGAPDASDTTTDPATRTSSGCSVSADATGLESLPILAALVGLAHRRRRRG